MDLAQGNLGAEVVYELDLVDGKLVLNVGYDGKQADANVIVKLEPGLFLDKLAALIPGKIDDAIIAMLKQAFGL